MSVFLEDIRGEFYQYYDALVIITPKILIAMVVLVIAWVVSRQIRQFSDKRLKQKMEDPLLAEFLATLIRTVVFIIGVSVAFRVMGFGGVTASILAGAGITAFVIGFALRDIGENFLAGIIMAFKRPFRVGDFVESGPVQGKVLALSLRDTQIKTPDGKDVFVPNANIIKNPLINYTIDGFLRFDFVVSLPAGSDYKGTMKAIEDAAGQVEGVLRKRRKTTVNVTGIAPGKLDATVSFWIDTFKVKHPSETIRSEVILAVQKVLEAPR